MPVTETLAAYVACSTLDAIPPDVQREATRALVNYLGCALGGSIEPALDIAIATMSPFSGERNACVLGRAERFDALHAALLNGIGSHVHEYDDTLPKNYIHPSVPVGSALFAYASANEINGRDFVHAFILGFEVESRIGNAVYPAHYQAGWHITSTTGVFGAAAAVGKLLRLTTKQMVWAFDRYETVVASDRSSAIAQLRRYEPAVVTMDLGLPPQPDDPSEGFKLLEEIHGLAPDTKVIVLTGQNDRVNALKAISLGAHDFCTKPFEPELLTWTIDRAFRVHELQEENARLLAPYEEPVMLGIITRDP